KLQGVDVSPFFTKEFYQKKYPIWNLSDEDRLYGEITRKKDKGNQTSDSLSFDVTQISILLVQVIVLFITIILFRKYAKKSDD
ncbi:MAG: hypothetical protein KAR12_05280, partial [Methylococcales bacterium]|nr:hypothetical protein [Methylococcales bacterium]